MFRKKLSFRTKGRQCLNITSEIEQTISQAKANMGLCHLFLMHTSASLILCENSDPDVLSDLEYFMQKIAPDGDVAYRHRLEGKDDMPAHIRTVITQNSLTIPVENEELLLGTWQGIFLWEHRESSHHRNLILSIFS